MTSEKQLAAFQKFIAIKKENGRQIHLAGNVSMDKGIIKVKSQTDPNEVYTCTLDNCTCPDFQKHCTSKRTGKKLNYSCKHLFAVACFLGIEECTVPLIKDICVGIAS